MTYYFCTIFLKRADRTTDQMVQAARSGKQNIVEGSAASATSGEMEIKLINVAKASLQELLMDYEDFLRTRGHRQWEDDSVKLAAMRRLGRNHNDSAFFMQMVKNKAARNHCQHGHCTHQTERRPAFQAAQSP
ncbi:four helix bundle protein [Desulfobotulus alkaliphilus]